MWNSLRIAFSTLTLLPVSPKQWKSGDIKNSVAFYPLVGALLGGLLALIAQIELVRPLKPVPIFFLWVLLTAAFHLDGLGDCCDGFFGGKTPEDRRRIMKDPSVGAYGVTGIGMTLLFKYNFIASIFSDVTAWRWLILVPLAARWAVRSVWGPTRPIWGRTPVSA